MTSRGRTVRDLIDAARAASLLATAERLRLTVRRTSTTSSPGSIAPCPSCGAKTRSKSDRRGPLGITPDDKRWRCHACKESGDSLNLAARVRHGRDFSELSRDERQGLWEAFDDAGIVASPPRPEPQYPRRDDVARVWDESLVADVDGGVIERLAARGLDARTVAASKLARLIALDAPLPNWAGSSAGTWAESRHLLVFELVDHAGERRSLLARTVEPAATGQKSLSPRGHRARHLFLANTQARELLRSQSRADAAEAAPVIIAEGEMDLLSWDAAHDGPVIAIRSGSWSAPLAERLAACGRPIVIATDLDAAGEQYAAEIERGLLAVDPACPIERWPHPTDAVAGATDANEYVVAGRTLVPRGRPLRSVVQSASAPHEPPEAEPPDQVTEAEAQEEPDWDRLLKHSDKGHVVGSLANLVQILTHDPAWRGVLAFDERRVRPVFIAQPPWAERYAGTERGLPRLVVDADLTRLLTWVERAFGATCKYADANHAVIAVARQRGYDEVREFFDGLTWDGTARLDTWLVDLAGARDTPLVRAYGARWLIGAVARTYAPGAKMDTMLVLEAPQGTRKSTLIRDLVGAGWFSDEIPALGSKDASIQMLGPLVIEFGELDALQKVEVSRVKAFLSRSTDRYRPPYAVHASDHPRRLVFAGSTNDSAYLRDPTGARRFWPVVVSETKPVDLVALLACREQLWAEAVARYRGGEQWWIDEPHLVAATQVETDAREVMDPWFGLVDAFLARANPPFVTTEQLLAEALEVEPARQTRADSMRVADVLRELGWVRRPKRLGRKSTHVYVRPPVLPASPVPPVATVATSAATQHQPVSAPSRPGLASAPSLPTPIQVATVATGRRAAARKAGGGP